MKNKILGNFLQRVRSLPSFWSIPNTQKRPSWFDDPLLVKPYRKARKAKKRARAALRRARRARGQNPRTGAPA